MASDDAFAGTANAGPNSLFASDVIAASATVVSAVDGMRGSGNGAAPTAGTSRAPKGGSIIVIARGGIAIANCKLA